MLDIVVNLNEECCTTNREEKEELYKKELEANDWPLFEKLREWRKGEANKIAKPLYIILDNQKLAKIAHARPKYSCLKCRKTKSLYNRR